MREKNQKIIGKYDNGKKISLKNSENDRAEKTGNSVKVSNILKYESDIWKTADLLLGAGIKQSDFPKYMMPFFALVMVESRLIRESKRLKSELGEVSKDDFIEMFQLEGLG